MLRWPGGSGMFPSRVGRRGALIGEQAGLERLAVAADWVLSEVGEWNVVVAAWSQGELEEYHAAVAAGFPACSELPARPPVYSSLYPRGSLPLFQVDCEAAKQWRCWPQYGGARRGGETTNRLGEGAHGPTR